MGRVASGWGGESLGEGLLPLTLVTATRRVDTSRNEVSTSAACAPAGGRMRYCTCFKETTATTTAHFWSSSHSGSYFSLYILFLFRKWGKLGSQKALPMLHTSRTNSAHFPIIVVYFASTSVDVAAKQERKRYTSLPTPRRQQRIKFSTQHHHTRKTKKNTFAVDARNTKTQPTT